MFEAEVEVIENAIASLIEQMDKGNVRVPVAYLIRAIDRRYEPLVDCKKEN